MTVTNMVKAVLLMTQDHVFVSCNYIRQKNCFFEFSLVMLFSIVGSMVVGIKYLFYILY